ncbi:Nucleotidyltransferase/DNA polymerase for DNA repair [Levilactobacillus brevis ATCC 367]|uniref:DNA polymerase IV n=1 Tax=Levilactobacillus brevis (strain ATCC 367 / BCRC 12310 / CIP 105137 / JCM 1170 / LMG 11437 / NCIMB 947 / NCTC 947) TaxID=387344 RepID=Q03R40_LEVBA|nr:DNA polymerase IV [Levilactobacillus brevis]ABJ64332.1 Nucleotidyltransferase/DNA polymerase for DNA repair [Levilactobacillus brevis ATCC 367]
MIPAQFTQRKIIHVDMDAFYASIEERDHPAFKQHPLIIAQDPRKTGGRGVVATANYAARQLGVHSAMNANEALKLAPQAIFQPPNFPLYRQISDQIHEIFHEYTDKIEPVAFDEAYLDVTENKHHLHSAVQVAHEIQVEIFEKTHLTCSTGISYSKFLAKEASDFRKPVGVSVILPEDAHDFLMALPIERFRGVGKKTVPKMHELGNSYLEPTCIIGQSWPSFMSLVNLAMFCISGSEELTSGRLPYQRERKSIGKERTYGPPLTTLGEVENQLQRLAEMVAATVQEKQRHGKTLVLKLRTSAFKTLTKRYTQADFIANDAQTYYDLALDLYQSVAGENEQVRLLGITITGLAAQTFENVRLPLFDSDRLN